VGLTSTEGIRQILERERGRIRLSFLENGGANVVLRELDGLPGVQAFVRSGSAGEDLQHLFARWRGSKLERVVERELLDPFALPNRVDRGSAHLARLWAAAEVARMPQRDRAAAIALAVDHQIVTPLTARSCSKPQPNTPRTVFGRRRLPRYPRCRNRRPGACWRPPL
jgi:hypothetical protein